MSSITLVYTPPRSEPVYNLRFRCCGNSEGTSQQLFDKYHHHRAYGCCYFQQLSLEEIMGRTKANLNLSIDVELPNVEYDENQ